MWLLLSALACVQLLAYSYMVLGFMSVIYGESYKTKILKVRCLLAMHALAQNSPVFSVSHEVSPLSR